MPLSTHEQWVVDQKGVRAKLACVNWPAHMETLIPEGLAHVSMDKLVDFIDELEFNCVRFPYSVEMTERFQEKIGERVGKFMSSDSRLGFYKQNPDFTEETTVYQVFSRAMETLKSRGIMVVLDNHVSKATWCCPEFDGNRFWEKEWFIVEAWIKSLKLMASLVKTNNWSHIIGLGLRNEVFSVRLDADALWYKYMRLGMLEIHKVNPDLLLIVGGQVFASRFTQLFLEPLIPDTEEYPQTLRNKLVYEAHYYNLLYVNWWWDKVGGPVTCTGMRLYLNINIGFLQYPGKRYTAPIWLSEFGMNVTDFSEDGGTNDNQWLDCLTDWMIDRDIDWGYWVLNGHYYYRQGNNDYAEDWGLLCDDHQCKRNEQILNHLRPLMKVSQGPGVSKPPASVLQNRQVFKIQK